MNKKLFIGLLCAAIIGLAGVTVYSLQAQDDIALADAHYVGLAQGLYHDEFTFDNIINKFSTHIAAGTVIDSAPLSETRTLFTVQLEQTLAGHFDHDQALVYVVDDRSLQLGEKYLLFLSEFSSTLYEQDFFVALEEFILKIENGIVHRLIDPELNEFVLPFADHEYNHYEQLIEYISQNVKQRNMLPTGSKAVEEYASLDELQENSDHIFEIRAEDVLPVNNNLALVDYEIIQTYKGGELNNVYYLLLPDSVEKNDVYLLFLKEDPSGSVTLSTRKGSIIQKDSTEYEEVVQTLKK